MEGDFMTAEFSSAGLLYVYIRGYEETGKVFTEQADTYRYIGNSLYHKIMEMVDEAENAVHIFAVVGSKDKANFVSSIFENELRENFRRILNGSRIKTDTSKLDDVGNVFFRCVQEFYCAQLNHFPKRVSYDYGDIAINCIYCLCNENENAIVDAVVSLWSEREQPELCGKQLITRSFFMRDFVDRKVIASIPDAEDGSWRLVF